MESTPTLKYLTKPKINKKLPYISDTKEIYVNLFKISLKKELKIFQYPYSVTPEIEAGDLTIRNNIFKKASRQLKSIYGECFLSGDSLYAIKDIQEIKSVVSKLYNKNGKTDYTVTFQKRTNVKTINEQDIQKDQLAKQCIELLIRDILHSNQNLEFYKGLFVRKDQKELIKSYRFKVNFYPGFTTSFMETDSGNYLNVTLKNKIISTDNILTYLIEKNYTYKKNHEKIRNYLKDRSFKVSYAKKNYVIYDISFDRNPTNTDFKNDDGKTINLIKYYNEAHKIEIKDKNQPLILVKKFDSQKNEKILYFIPELCYLAGLDDFAKKDSSFMKKLADYTKLSPNDRVKKTNEFLDLLKDDTKYKEHPDQLSAKEKSEIYGIEVNAVDKMFKASYMNETKVVARWDKVLTQNTKNFEVIEKKNMWNWVCFYEKMNYNDADYLNNTLNYQASNYGLSIGAPKWEEMYDDSPARYWIQAAEKFFGQDKSQYSFAIFFIGRNDDYLYKQLKTHSLCTNGYISQVVKVNSFYKNPVGVCSKILLQINSKLGGVSYKINMNNNIIEKKLMVIGVDSSHIKGKRTAVAMVSTVNESFTTFFNKEKIIEEKTKDQLQYCISKFIEEAISAYEYKNGSKNLPKGIIIYRQGVSLQQKEFLKNEVNHIKNICNSKNIKYYYILVNTKTTYKFFETNNESNEYLNPAPGLLFTDGITNKNFFEFYIQPQKVTGGSATPTCYHVAYGDLDFAEMIPKFTYDLCHIYSNWQGTIRVPNVIKAAEKLSKMTAKYTLCELNENLKFGQAYL